MFSFPFGKSRRRSEPAINPEIAAQAAANVQNNLQNLQLNTSNDNSLSRVSSRTSNSLGVPKNGLRRTRSRRKSHSHIFSKRLSFFGHNNSSDDLNSLATSNNSDTNYESLELSRFKSLNYDKFKKESLQYLKFHGFSAPKILNDSNYIRISISSTGENVFLPSVMNFNEEDVDNLDLDNNEPPMSPPRNQNDGSQEDYNDDDDVEDGPTRLTEETSQRNQNDNEGEPVTHTFAITISLSKPTQISTITTQLQSTAKILWPDGIPYDRNIKNEIFELGQLSWDLSLSNYNYYVPYQDTEDALIDDNNNELNSVSNHNDPSRFITENRIPPKSFQENTIDQITRGPFINTKKNQDPFIIKNLQPTGSISYPPGDYIFQLPILFPTSIAESLISQNAVVSYNIRTIVVQPQLPSQKNRVYNLGEKTFNVIRGPPSNAVSTSDKPVYVNKVWNEALSYEVSFPQKFVTVGSNLPIKLKFAPLIKDISIRRIRVNILEKVTYCSKDLRYEYDETSTSKNEGVRATSSNERVLPLLEVRTKTRTELALREELLKDLLREDNLLSNTYKSQSGYKYLDDTEVIGQLRLVAYLPFIRPLKLNKDLQLPKNNELSSLIYNNDKHKSQIDKKKTSIVTNQGENVPFATHYNEFSGDGLIPDSSNNKFIKINHKLQIAIRVSKKDQHGKMHHYEVMIDTPVYILNSSCTPANVELPPYIAIDGSDGIGYQPTPYYGQDEPPSFEEAISPMNSPSMTPYQGMGIGEETIDVLSRTSTIGGYNTQYPTPPPTSSSQFQTQQPFVDYDNIDDLVRGTSNLNIPQQPQRGRRRSSVANDIILNLRRTATNNSYNMNRSTDSGLNKPNSQQSEAITEDHEGEAAIKEDFPPPTYSESVPLSHNSESEIESLSSLDDQESYNDENEEGTDLTDQFKFN
ncbi:hypothetical protein BN7_2918 [Wickerhamomyces ciferrii]|uniref:Arrestin C-terminal-like domain-containing protein n=1 Tax=Wickerhamomyces ciferrii (strain ATCC 14091 / BCRC 22168 / CBS 111 / JCM 3599 / NBRC 0793 / NRRL Y-1031 F-60-10) TaxID=1206466 RepID=K0KE44_WICCF|nr:uncharacterized protein BN7_2918 [Wickerhamomyces ciferrii]CCH43370.1 hypothetical protein BN7_2918 [Wickerhamomyces ciferrii]